MSYLLYKHKILGINRYRRPRAVKSYAKVPFIIYAITEF